MEKVAICTHEIVRDANNEIITVDNNIMVRNKTSNEIIMMPMSKKLCAYDDDTAEQHGLSQPTLSRIVKRVVEAVAGHINKFIQFPEGNEILRLRRILIIWPIAQIINKFIQFPEGNEILRKEYYSLNVQMVCDAKIKTRNIVARWRGSTHDSRIWESGSLKLKFEIGK
ncbi:DDE superfamily endonuclease [Popillia japonica]|uniref:DDE superfamily endonuclease n=1 Tax=Popillia japonica TaxID=7064 RepID=A0AAW1LRP1_POPJA